MHSLFYYLMFHSFLCHSLRSTVKESGNEAKFWALMVGSFPITTIVGVQFVLLALEFSTRGASG